MSKNHIHFFFRFILECILGYTLESSIHIEPFFCRGLKVWYVSLRSTPCLRFLLRNLQPNIKNNTTIISMNRYAKILQVGEKNGEPAMRKRKRTTRLFPPSTSILFPNTTNGKFSGSDGLA